MLWTLESQGNAGRTRCGDVLYSYLERLDICNPQVSGPRAAGAPPAWCNPQQGGLAHAAAPFQQYAYCKIARPILQ